MRILMVSDVHAPRVNGVSTSIATFRQSLSELGHHSVLLAPAYGANDVSGPDLIRIKSRPVPRDPEDRLISYRQTMALADQLAGQQFDVVHIHTPFVAHYAGLALARRLKVPVVETYHTFFEEYLHHYMPFLPKALLRFGARRLSVSQCQAVDALVVPSQQMMTVLRDYGVGVRAEVLPTGIDVEQFRGGLGERFRAQWGIGLDRPVLVHVSRVAFEKNIDFILRALVVIKRSVPDVLLVIAGEGPAREHLKRLVREWQLSEQVLFVGNLDRATELLDCYRAGDVFVFASRTETQGLVLMEALALGVPVVSTAVMGTADVLQGVRGALIAPDEVDGFASTVTRVLSDKALRQQLAAAAPSDATAWSATAMAERLVALYAAVIAEKRGRSAT